MMLVLPVVDVVLVIVATSATTAAEKSGVLPLSWPAVGVIKAKMREEAAKGWARRGGRSAPA
jgi:hypothetical protein